MLREQLRVQPSQFLRGEAKNDGKHPDQVGPHLSVFQKLQDDIPKVLVAESALGHLLALLLNGALLTSRLTSSSSLLSLSVGVDMPVLAPLALCVAALNAVRLLSMLGLPSLKGVEGSGLVILDLETPAPEGFEDDQYPTPGFRCFSMSWTEDWILRISSLSVLLLFFSLSPYDFDSSS